MSKIKTTLKEPDIDNRLLDDRGVTVERARRGFRDQQSPIVRAVSRGTISEQHGRAAAKFYHHWYKAKWPSDLITNWKAEISPGGHRDHIPLAKTESEAFHRDQVYRATAVIHGAMDRCGMSRDAIKLLFSVVCDENPFELAGKIVWPRMGENAAGARAITYVRGALRALSIEWGI